MSGWLADTAAHRLRFDAGRRAIAEWEADNGPLTAEELADGLVRARALLGGPPQANRRSDQHRWLASPYDTGALIAAERNDRRMWALHADFPVEEVAPVVPAPVLAMCNVEWMTEDQARQVSVLAGRSGHDDVVDVTMVEGALRRGDAVVTSNREHLEKVGQAAGLTFCIEDV
ncbi:MAG TPA: hypothetical protein VK784_13465 [Pseudonocardiaceae bacterium]|nr:hypothetical protein [Pseudonocardiaceae bacterium]